MRALVLGGSGMLGHKVFQTLSATKSIETFCTMRATRSVSKLSKLPIFNNEQTLWGLDVGRDEVLSDLLATISPDVVINCIGVVKQKKEAQNPIECIATNALLPHRVARIADELAVRFIHISTDCVFDGSRGRYSESDLMSARDLYGQTKFLGEVQGVRALTIRTSIIGRELASSSGLLEWFLSQAGREVRGYSNVLYSGTTTVELAHVLESVILRHPKLHGLYQLASPVISKCELLAKARDHFGLNMTIVPDASEVSDRSLIGSRFCVATGYSSPNWDELIEAVAKDPTPYEEWRKLIST